MHEFKIDGKLCRIATEWPELSEKQVLAIAPYLYADRKNPEVQKYMQQVIYPLPKNLLRRFEAWDLFRFREFCTWVFDKPLYDTAITKFKFKGTWYFLPEKDFSDIVLFEYAMADHYFRKFTQKKPDLPALDNLVSTICRPQKSNLNLDDPEFNGDPREKYNTKLADRRVKAFAELPINLKIIVLHAFVAGQRVIHTRYKEIFSQASGSGGKSTGPDFGWFGLLDDLAEQSTFGDYEKTAFTNMHTICFHLRKKHYQLKELERNN